MTHSASLRSAMTCSTRLRRRSALLLAAALSGVLCASAARAEDDERGPIARAPLLPSYVQECGACHLAYPPQLLGPASWRRLMGSLDKHFGTDASLDGATARQISAWLAAQAGRGADAGADRITSSTWFLRKHREAATVAADGSVRRMSDCAACHRGAAQGRFDDDK